MIKVLEGFGIIFVLFILISLIFAIVKYIAWTAPIIKERFFKKHSDEIDEKLARLDFEDWLSDNKKLFIIIFILLGLIGLRQLLVDISMGGSLIL